MKTNIPKLNLKRKVSVTTSNKDVEGQSEDKTTKLLQLREKIEKEREMMRKTGKRFGKTGQISTSSKEIVKQQSSNSYGKSEKSSSINLFAKKQKTHVEVSTRTDNKSQNESKEEVRPSTAMRESINLTELISDQQTTSLQGSKLFEKQIHQQKTRNNEIYNYLKQLGLEQFTQGLISMGYDDMEVLIEVKNQQLNFLMMRANQQRKLTAALEQYRKKQGLGEKQKQQPLVDKPAFLKTKTTMNYKPKPQEHQIVSPAIRPKSAFTQASTTPTNNSCLQNNSQFFSNPSFFYGIGSQDWSMELLTRRACSSCFKVTASTELTKIQDCYYCLSCKQKQQDVLGITMNESMVRNYDQ